VKTGILNEEGSRFDKPFRQAQGPEPVEGLKALSPPIGKTGRKERRRSYFLHSSFQSSGYQFAA
jgi:hypothetical protein